MGTKSTQSVCRPMTPLKGLRKKIFPILFITSGWLLVSLSIPHINSNRSLLNVPVDVNIDFKINNVALRNPFYLKN